MKTYQWALVSAFIFQLFTAAGATCTCGSIGIAYLPGDILVDDQVCGVCADYGFGIRCYGSLGGTCSLNSTVAEAGDPACLYNMKIYLVGDVFPTLDGCNKCLCTEHGMQCTMKACNSVGFEKPSKEPIYGECLYDGGWYRHHTQWLSRDGCNTCFCHSVGNYQGGYECTKSKCACSPTNQPVITELSSLRKRCHNYADSKDANQK